MFTTTPTLSEATRITSRNRRNARSSVPVQTFDRVKFEAAKRNVLNLWASMHAQTFNVPEGIYGKVAA